MSVPFPEVPRVEVDEVKRRLDAGESLILIDVRRPESYAASHIPGARSLGIRAIVDRTHDLPQNQEIVLY